MKDLRDEVRAAFEKEQAAHPPTADMRRSIVAATTVRPRRESRVQWIAVTAALVITALVIASLVSSRLAVHPSVPSHRAPVGDYGPPPPGVALFYALDSKNPAWFIGYDWSGTPRGTIKLEKATTGGIYQAPDGSAFGYAVNGKGIGIEAWLDRLGRPISDPDQTNYQSVMWAPDSRHVCTLDGAGGQWRVGLKTPGSPSTAHVVNIPGTSEWGGIIALSIAACSPARDRMILVRNYWGVAPIVWSVRISDGSILGRTGYEQYAMSGFVASGDGTLIAENSSKSDGYIGSGAAANTKVRRADNGSVIATLDPTYAVLAFSADDNVALVATTPRVGGTATHLALVRLADSAVLWRYEGAGALDGLWVQPGGSDIAVALRDLNGTTLNGLFILRADGTSTSIARLP